MKFLFKAFLITFTLIQAVQAGRYYNTENGRFISRDPITSPKDPMIINLDNFARQNGAPEKTGYHDGISLYNAYFAENFGLDPSGLSTECCKNGETRNFVFRTWDTGYVWHWWPPGWTKIKYRYEAYEICINGVWKEEESTWETGRSTIGFNPSIPPPKDNPEGGESGIGIDGSISF